MSNMTKDGLVELGSVEDERFDVGPAVPHGTGFHCIKHGSNVDIIDHHGQAWCAHCWMEQSRSELIPEERE